MTLENAAIPGGADTAAPVSVRDDVLAAFKEVEAPETPEVRPEETAQQKADRIRDEQGRFAKADEAKAEPKAEAKTPELKPDAAAVDKADDKADKSGKPQIEPPVHWKGEEKLNWAVVPNKIKAAIAEDYKQRQELEARAGQWESVITPQRQQQLSAAYGDARSGLKQILETVEYSNQDPVGFLKWYAQTRGINLGSLVQSGQEQPQIQPELQQVLSPLMSEVTSLKQMVQQRQIAEEAQQQAQTQAELNAFFSDHQNYPFAQDVRRQMGVLIQAAADQRQVLSLKDAYDQAVWANPQTRSQLLAQQAQQSTQQLQATAQQKRQLSASVAGAPGTAQPLQAITNPKATVREDVMEAMRQAGGRI